MVQIAMTMAILLDISDKDIIIAILFIYAI